MHETNGKMLRKLRKTLTGGRQALSVNAAREKKIIFHGYGSTSLAVY